MATEKLRSARSLMETADLDTIKAGGASSSELLNLQREAILTDLAELDRRTSELETELDRANTIYGVQNTLVAAYLSSLESQLPASSTRWLADFYTDSYFGPESTAAHAPLYGQVTLPVLRKQENLVGYDTRDRIWIPETTRVSYATLSGTPGETDWLFDDRAVYALDGRPDTAWWRERPSSQVAWVRVQVPPNLHAHKHSNCILLHAWPSLAMHLLSLEYRNPAGTWTAADLSYLLGWNGSKVQFISHLRVWIPPTQVTEFRLKLDLANVSTTHWGFSHLGLQWNEFQPSATLIADFQQHNPPTLDTATILGKDQASLAYLGKSITGPQVSVSLTQISQGTTPVITGVEVTT